jgi:D-alanyl-D-alanine carboxypeptidase
VRLGLILLLNLFAVFVHAYSVTELESSRRKFGAPGLGAGLITPQTIEVWTTGVRKVGHVAPLQNSDKFHLGSNTKAMTATLLAQMIEAGTLRWQSTLREIFPEITLRSEYVNVTLEMLTAHRSGITSDMGAIENGELWSWMWLNSSSQIFSERFDISQRILAFPPQQTPGTGYLYSNWNYIIIGAVLEKFSQLSWEELMQQKLFKPLQMSSCGFGATANIELSSPDQPWPHTLEKGVFVPMPSNRPHDNPRGFGPAGTAHCSLADWGKFLRAHIDGFQNKDTAILRAAGFAKLHTPYPGQQYTPGGWLRLSVGDRPVLQHTGSNTMNFSNVWLFPADGTGFIATANAADSGSTVFDLTDAVIGQLLKTVGGL